MSRMAYKSPALKQKKLSRVLVTLASLSVLFAWSCSYGLEPAGSDPVVSILFSTPEPPSPRQQDALFLAPASRALTGASGFLLFRAESDAGVSVYGPWSVSAGKPFVTTDVASGTYRKFRVVYSSQRIDSAWLASLSSESFAADLAKKYPGQTVWNEKSGLVLTEGKTTNLALTLIPAVPESLTIDPASSDYFVQLEPDAGEISAFRFVSLKNLSSGLAEGETLSSVILTAAFEKSADAASPESTSLDSLSLYSATGSKLASLPAKNGTEGDLSWTFDFASSGLKEADLQQLYIGCLWPAESLGWMRIDMEQIAASAEPVDPVTTPSTVAYKGSALLKGWEILAFASEYSGEETEVVPVGGFGAGIGTVGADGSASFSLYSIENAVTLWAPVQSKKYSYIVIIRPPKNTTVSDLPALVEAMAKSENFLEGTYFYSPTDPVSPSDGVLSVNVAEADLLASATFHLYPESKATSFSVFDNIGTIGGVQLSYPTDPMTGASYIRDGFVFAGWALSPEDAATGLAAYKIDALGKIVYTGLSGTNIPLWGVWKESKEVPINQTLSFAFLLQEETLVPPNISGGNKLPLSGTLILSADPGLSSYLWLVNGAAVGSGQTLSLVLSGIPNVVIGDNEVVLIASSEDMEYAGSLTIEVTE